MTHEMRAWCRNLVEAGRMKPGEEVLVIVDEPLVEQGSRLAEAVRRAGGNPRLELWAGPNRPLEHPPPGVTEGAETQEPIGDEANARFELLETLSARGCADPAVWSGAGLADYKT